jgi:hypothetical protein
VNAKLRRQDRPAHHGEATDEEAGLAPHDVMLGLEPGDHARLLIRLDLSEPNKGMHLVRVAAHFLGHALEPLHERIGAVLHRLAVVADAAKEGVEQGRNVRLAMADDERSQSRKGFGTEKVGRVGGGSCCAPPNRLRLAPAAQSTCDGGTSASASARAASRQPSRSSSASSRTTSIRRRTAPSVPPSA